MLAIDMFSQSSCSDDGLQKQEHDDDGGIRSPPYCWVPGPPRRRAAVTDHHHSDFHSSFSSSPSPTQKSINNHHVTTTAVAADEERQDNNDSYTYPSTQNQSTSCTSMSNTSCIPCDANHHHQDDFHYHSFTPQQAIHHHHSHSSFLTWNIAQHQYDDVSSFLSETFPRTTSSTPLLDHATSFTHLATTTAATDSSNMVMDYYDSQKDTDAWLVWMYSLLHGPLLEPPPSPPPPQPRQEEEDADKDHHTSAKTAWSSNKAEEDGSFTPRLAPAIAAATNMANNSNNENNHDDECVLVDHPPPPQQDADVGDSVEHAGSFDFITAPPDRQQQQAWNNDESEEHECPVPLNKGHHHSQDHHEETLLNIGEDSWVLMDIDPLLLEVPGTFEDPEDPEDPRVSTFAVRPKSPAKKPVPKNKKQRCGKFLPFKDSTPGNRKYVERYTELDVLSGRGGAANYHFGNLEYHAAKMQLQSAYLSGTTKAEKTKIVCQLINAIRDKGGRFLEKHGGQWYEMHPDAAYRKCRQVLATQSSKNHVPQSRVAKRSSKNK